MKLTAVFLAAATSMAAADPGRLVVIGDSITQATAGATTQNGTRSCRWELFRRLHDGGARLRLRRLAQPRLHHQRHAARRRDQSVRADPSRHSVRPRARGHWGWRAYQVAGESAGPTAGKRGSGDITTWTDPAKGGYRADTATILLGINDLGETTPRTSAQVTNDLAVVVRTLQAANPAVRVPLCELLHVSPVHAQYPALNTRTDALNGLLPALGAALSTASSTVTVVSMRNGQPGGWDAAAMTYDGIHPNSAGERYVGGRIADALGAVSLWTEIPLANPGFEGGFTGAGTAACRPNGWTIFGTPNPAAVPKGLTDVSIVAESPADTGTGNAGSSYIIAGAADTGLEQPRADTRQPGRRYMLRAMLYKASSAAGPGDYGLELWAGTQRIAAADNLQPLPMYQTGATGAVGRRLKEFSCAIDSDTLPALLGQPLRVRLVSRHASRYMGFEDVRLDWRPLAAATPAKKTVYILTGQSNSLGATYGDETDKLPGTDPADREVAFWWNNFADAGVSIGDCGGVFTGLRAQQGMYYGINFASNGWFPVTTANTLCETHWGPEINFARTLHHAGRRDIAVIKVSRGGGGNTLWDKASGGHMYAAVTSTVRRALARLDAEGVTYEVAGLLYVQGESNSAAEAAEADVRFLALLDNLRADLPNAARMRGYIGGISIAGADAATTRTRHEALAAARPDRVAYVSLMDLGNEVEPDNLHFRKTAKLAIGARLAQAVLEREAA
ncbi:MAG: sialate O-acetylesterase [Kiritimatiellia bacterium]